MENSQLLWNKLTKRFALSTFNNQARIWLRFCRITYNGSLQGFISEVRQFLNKVISVKVEVGTPMLAFTILTKLPEEYHNSVEKVMANTETVGKPNAILNLLHDVMLKKEALNLQTTNQSLELNREIFCSKTIHYCRDGKHNPLANDTACTIVLDTGASNHMFNDMRLFTDLTQGVNMAISTGCDKSTLREAGEGTAWLMDKNGKICSLKNCLYIPDLITYLVALSQLARHITIKNEENNYKVFLKNSNKPAFTCEKNRRILETYVTLPRSIGLYTANEDWHKQLGNMHEEGIKRLIPSFKQRKTWDICTSNADTSDLPSNSATEGDIFHDALEELPGRIRVIRTRHPTLISSEITTNDILPFS
ncbi:hypothetical protein O181_030600 [Austropuccinia psidii MF-1]|uniref:Retrovirus-related Pol polyprotein from transposon TNT 1-94-like beta-barrel domain-containing protein n=1 Tax=Austropuccinia psidii MF-1 TaxID=1389203 RepID=A0A9Q3H6D5_9BASI|nr:hypothetical protein [Austropuccinia psidii MF-1]